MNRNSRNFSAEKTSEYFTELMSTFSNKHTEYILTHSLDVFQYNLRTNNCFLDSSLLYSKNHIIFLLD